MFRFRAYDLDALKTPGPVLLIPNHLSWIDWLFLWVCLDEDWKFVTSSISAQTSWLHRKMMINRYTLPIDTSSPYAVKRMAEFLKGGGRLVLFAEGRLSRTGTLMKLFDGTGFLIFKTKAKVITAYLRGAGRLPFSPNPGWKKCFPKVTAHFSATLAAPELGDISTGRARALLTSWLRDQMVRQQFEVEMAFGAQNVLSAVAETARKHPGHIILEDATLQTLTYRKLMVGADVLAHALRGTVAGGERVGLLMPNVNATPVVILALWSLGKVPAVLNFSSGTPTMLACAELAGLKHIVTSRAFLERARLNADDFVKAGISLIYLEDVRAGITGSRKFLTLLRHVFHSAFSLRHQPVRRLHGRDCFHERLRRRAQGRRADAWQHPRQHPPDAGRHRFDRPRPPLQLPAAFPQLRSHGGDVPAAGARDLCLPLSFALALPQRCRRRSTTATARCLSARTPS